MVDHSTPTADESAPIDSSIVLEDDDVVDMVASEVPAPPSIPPSSRPTAILSTRTHGVDFPNSAHASEAAGLEATLLRLRAEGEASTNPSIRARLELEMGELRERMGNDASAAEHYQRAFQEDPHFREAVEALLRVRREGLSPSVEERIVDILVSSANDGEESARALMLRAQYLDRMAPGSSSALHSARQAAESGASSGTTSWAWLWLESAAARRGDRTLRAEALARRLDLACDPTWRALLQVDLAYLKAELGALEEAFELLQEARKISGPSMFRATVATAALVERFPGPPRSDENRRRTRLRAEALRLEGALIADQLASAAQQKLPRASAIPRPSEDPAAAIDAWLRSCHLFLESGDPHAAADVVDRAHDLASQCDEELQQSASPLLLDARMRVASAAGVVSQAVAALRDSISETTLPASRAAVWLRIASYAEGAGDRQGALEAIGEAINAAPTSIAARARQLELLSTKDGLRAAKAWSALGKQFETSAAKRRAHLIASYIYSLHADDPNASERSLDAAHQHGLPDELRLRVARTLASLSQQPRRYEIATRRLLAVATHPMEIASLGIELVRSRMNSKDAQGALDACLALHSSDDATWLGLATAAFATTFPAEQQEAQRLALEAFLALPANAPLATGLGLALAFRHARFGQWDAALSALVALPPTSEAHVTAASFASALLRRTPPSEPALECLRRGADNATSPNLVAALRLNAAFAQWRLGHTAEALELFEQVKSSGLPGAARPWAWARAALECLRNERPSHGEIDGPTLALDRFAFHVRDNETDAAMASLATAEVDGRGALAIGAAMARVCWPAGALDSYAYAEALQRIAATGPEARGQAYLLILAGGHRDSILRAARTWAEGGGGLDAAVEWFVAALAAGNVEEELLALETLATHLRGPEQVAALTRMALLRTRHGSGDPLAGAVASDTPLARLTNLESAPAGCDPRRRAAALDQLRQSDLASDATYEAMATGKDPMAQSLAGWSFLVAGDTTKALDCFDYATEQDPTNLAAWEGLRATALVVHDSSRRAKAAAALGSRCTDPALAAEFWEEAGATYEALGDITLAESAYTASFRCNPRRPLPFQKALARARVQGDSKLVLSLVSDRIAHTDDPTDLCNLYWEEARALREQGDQERALGSTDNILLLEPGHTDALALRAEIFIRMGRIEEAAACLGQVAASENAPTKSRITAGLAAVDFYETKLQQHERALAILSMLHKAGLSNLGLRERLALAAARSGAWREATTILEALMVDRKEPEGRLQAARLALAIYRDRLGEGQKAHRPVYRILDDHPTDPMALDALVHLDGDDDTRRDYCERARDALKEVCKHRHADPAAAHRLAVIAHVLGEAPLEHLALSVASALGSNNPSLDEDLQQRSRHRRLPQLRLPPTLEATLVSSNEFGPLNELFKSFMLPLAEAFGPTLGQLGISRKDRADAKATAALRIEVAAWAGAFGLGEFHLYVGGESADAIAAIPGETPAIVLGPAVRAPLTPLQRARLAEEVFALSRGLTILRQCDETTLAAIVSACGTFCDVALSTPRYAVQGDVDRSVAKAIPKRQKAALTRICQSLAQEKPDILDWVREAQAALARVALLACNDVRLAMAAHHAEPMDRIPRWFRTHPDAEPLLAFAFSNDYLDLRNALGLASNP